MDFQAENLISLDKMKDLLIYPLGTRKDGILSSSYSKNHRYPWVMGGQLVTRESANRRVPNDTPEMERP